MAFKMKENSYGIPLKKEDSAMKFFGPRARARRQARRQAMRDAGGDTMSRAQMFLNPAAGIAQSLGFGSNTGIGRFLQGPMGGIFARGGSARQRRGLFGGLFRKNKKY
tara:strand:- start:205 stop:528 length:324 start_codon:yes stop_codon:yes gene_type:complete